MSYICLLTVPVGCFKSKQKTGGQMITICAMFHVSQE
uniref:Uncharacterized protein n=1 Tax=Anguilla anguilla TaxID=7936 RepID=A0A0E9QIK7_ANGAN